MISCWVERVGKPQGIQPQDRQHRTSNDYFEANNVEADGKVAVFLTVIGAKAHETLRSLLAPVLPRELTWTTPRGTNKALRPPAVSHRRTFPFLPEIAKRTEIQSRTLPLLYAGSVFNADSEPSSSKRWEMVSFVELGARLFRINCSQSQTWR